MLGCRRGTIGRIAVNGCAVFALSALLLVAAPKDLAAQNLDVPSAGVSDLPKTCVALSGAYSGDICGIREEAIGVRTYLGIPFAEAELWSLPRVTKDYGDVPFEALRFGAPCPQPGPAGPAGRFDCLNLNIYAPDEAKDAPVLLFIHGGAFAVGSNSFNVPGGKPGETLYDGTAFARDHGVVLVTINYRLGATGFLPVLKQPDGSIDIAPSNLGLRDQLAGMTWVHDNITAFGGDNKRITIFGESAGAMSVGLHVFSNPNRPSFIKSAIMDSNLFGYNYLEVPTRTPQPLKPATGAANVQSLEQLATMFFGCMQGVVDGQSSCKPAQSTPPSEITPDIMVKSQDLFDGLFVEAFVRLNETIEGMPLAPVVDAELKSKPVGSSESLFVRQPVQGLQAGAPIPVFMGFNGNEGLLFVESIAHIVPSVTSAKVYQEGVRSVFPDLADSILATPRYAPDTPAAYGFSSLHASNNPDARSETAFTNLINDAAFECGMLSADAKGRGAPVWIYNYTSPTVGMILPTLSLCNGGNAWGNSCHSGELPSVFNSVEQVGVTLTEDERKTARFANAAWARFAKNYNTTGPGAEFVRWDKDKPMINTIGVGRSDPTEASVISTHSNCVRIWDGVLPGAEAHAR